MNITPTVITAKALEGSVSSPAQSSSQSSSQGSSSSTSNVSTSFKEELETVKTQEESAATKTAQTEETVQTDKTAQSEKTAKTVEQAKAEEKPVEVEKTEKNTVLLEIDKNKEAIATKNSLNNLTQQIEKDKIEQTKIDKKDRLKESKKKDPIEELSSKIAKLNELKNNPIHTQAVVQKTDLSPDCSQNIKMDDNDITFFVNLVQNQNTSGQGVQIKDSVATFTDIKTEATQKTVQVSATLMSALDESMKTNKPFRIDFGKDIAVIMKVDKDGVLSANFIPGSGAVEAYLKNNIASLRQNFDNQELPYKELSYSNQQRQKQKQENNKENKDE